MATLYTGDLLCKVLKFSDVPKLIDTGFAPLQPDDLAAGGICLYRKESVESVRGTYFNNEVTRSYLVDSTKIFKMGFQIEVKDGTVILVAPEADPNLVLSVNCFAQLMW